MKTLRVGCGNYLHKICLQAHARHGPVTLHYFLVVFFLAVFFFTTPPALKPGGFGGPFGGPLGGLIGRDRLVPRRVGAFPPRPTLFVAAGFLLGAAGTGVLVLAMILLLLV